MILSNTAILEAIRAGHISIGNLTGQEDPSQPPFNTSSVDLTLGTEVSKPQSGSFNYDLRNGSISQFLSQHCDRHNITEQQPFSLTPNSFVLAKTKERVNFPITESGPNYSARVEGRSSFARCAILVHFTAPTIHAGFHGTITLEIINLGASNVLLFPEMKICQLIIEEVSGRISAAPNQFAGQTDAVGRI